jgi:hypothetical protein
MTNTSLLTTLRRRIMPLPPMVCCIRSADTPDTPMLQDIPEWEQLHPEPRQETIITTQATTPRWEAESLKPEESPIEVINILEDMHRRIEATIATASAAAPEMHAETLLTYKTSPQSGHSLTLIHDFLTAIQMRAQTLQLYDYATYVGVMRLITLMMPM